MKKDSHAQMCVFKERFCRNLKFSQIILHQRVSVEGILSYFDIAVSTVTTPFAALVTGNFVCDHAWDDATERLGITHTDLRLPTCDSGLRN
jgi:hypothetical protein